MADELKEIEEECEKADKSIAEHLATLSRSLANAPCYHLSLNWCDKAIDVMLVDEVFDELRKRFRKGENQQLFVIVSSAGGDIDSAYNLAMLFRRYAIDRLMFVVPRWAKSAATLLVCGGDQILMTPVAELGPLDPQITEANPWENRIESFSPLHIKSTLDLINEQYKDGKTELADALVKRLQYPLTLGSYKKSLDVGKTYLAELLRTRMLKGKNDLVEAIATKLTEGYADHGAGILCQAVRELGLMADEIKGDALEAAWLIHRLESQKRSLHQKREQIIMKKRLEELPPELLERVKADLGSESREVKEK